VSADGGPLRGRALLRNRYLNKGTAFTAEERDLLGLHGLLPPAIETLATQLERVRLEYDTKSTDLDRHIYLRLLQQRNSVLFYAFLEAHIAEILPIVYTPTVGIACQQWSRIYRREQGVYVTWEDRHRIDELLANALESDEIDVVVATDGERVLGLGDLGVGGMGIPIGKLALYTTVGGVDPSRTLPVMLDAGTDNDALLSDPLYLGARHRRIRGAAYDELIDAFVGALRRRLPGVVLQWEDFAQANATRLLERHRDALCSFNDDIQGTAAVSTAAILAGMRATRTPISELRLVVVGAGSAGTGIARQAVRAMIDAGLDERTAMRRCWLVDRNGLLTDDMDALPDIQRPFAVPAAETAGMPRRVDDTIALEDVVARVRPHALVGVSGQPGLFTEAVIRAMAVGVERPIVLPLSNPTPRAEAIPSDVIAWSDGRALVGTGSPFAPVRHRDRVVTIAQVNNVYVFPGVGLGAVAVGARRITDAMMSAAADAVGARSPAADLGPDSSLLPAIDDSPEIARHVARAVARRAIDDGDAPDPGRDLDEVIGDRIWRARYRPLGRG
jgi:malate dehydrogenase (oxaloacetate-decarboxylating)